MPQWIPESPKSWANVLGLIPVPMFGMQGQAADPFAHTVLLDGNRASFSISAIEDYNSKESQNILSWAWSANLRHALVIDKSLGRMCLCRWDSDSEVLFKLPHDPVGAFQLLERIEQAPALRATDVVSYLIKTFRQLREALSYPEPSGSIKVFNLLLTGSAMVENGDIDRAEWLRLEDLEAVSNLTRIGLPMPTEARSANVKELIARFVEPEETTGCVLHPNLLLRHALGQLYQEAHLVFERRPQQISLFGWGAGQGEKHGKLKRDVRFTPPALARLLTEKALDLTAKQEVTILDPACGSGVFLLEAARELELRGYGGNVTLKGFDISSASCSMASFCLEQLQSSIKSMHIRFEVECLDSLQNDWGAPDIILMNPPFTTWANMGTDEQDRVSQVLGPLRRGRPDIAMAFIWKAVRSLPGDGLVAAILPSALLETDAGLLWREAIWNHAEVRFLGRFKGHHYFPSSLVEPSFLVAKRIGEAADGRHDVDILIAEAGCEDKAIRAIRRGKAFDADNKAEFECYSAEADTFDPASWLPRPHRVIKLIDRLRINNATTVQDLFDVRQGIRTGFNKAFVIDEATLLRLPAKERAFFRPVAAIGEGRLNKRQFVFYPYGDGKAILNESDLGKRVATYYRLCLLPHKAPLQKRGLDRWWELTRERRWQWEMEPKLVSTYFGQAGNFAYDESGETVVLQGFSWFWKRGFNEGGEAGEASLSFEASSLPWAYLAILNSRFFESILASCCPQVSGGQFNLSKRFVGRAFLPDLAEDLAVPGQTVRSLSQLGRSIHKGNWPPGGLEEAVQAVYGL